MPSIPTTLIATSQPLNIANPQSIPYFPTGAIDLGVNANGTIFSVHPTILAWNFQAGASWSFFAGVAGPAIALSFNLAGNYDAQQIQVQLSGDKVQGGFLFGITTGLTLSFAIRQLSLHWVKNGWHSHFEATWNEKFVANANIKFDFIGLILGIVAKIFSENNEPSLLQQVSNINSQLLGSYGIYDSVNNGFAGSGNFSVNPAFNLPINLVPLIPGLAQINEGLEALLGGLFIGPTVGIGIPATVRLTGLEVGGTAYSNLQIGGDTIVGTASGAGQGGDTLKVNLERSPGLDFTLGFGARVSVLKLFSLGGSLTVDVLTALGIRPDLGTFPTSLSNTLGSNSLSDATADLQMAEVILEWPS